MRPIVMVGLWLNLVGLAACARSEAAPTQADAGTAAKPGVTAPQDGAVMLAPGVGSGQRLSDVTKPPHKPTLPPDLNVDGAVYWGLYKVCVSTAGEVNHVNVIKSAHTPALDEHWLKAIRTWRYRPYSIREKTVPFCHPLRLEVRSRR